MKFRFMKKKNERKKDKLVNFNTNRKNTENQLPNEPNEPKEESKSDKSDSEEEEVGPCPTRKKIIKSQSITDMLLSTGDEDVPDWSELSVSDKMQLFDPWNLVMIVSSICIFIGSLWISVGGIEVYRTGEYFIGFGS